MKIVFDRCQFYFYFLLHACPLMCFPFDIEQMEWSTHSVSCTNTCVAVPVLMCLKRFHTDTRKNRQRQNQLLMKTSTHRITTYFLYTCHYGIACMRLRYGFPHFPSFFFHVQNGRLKWFPEAFFPKSMDLWCLCVLVCGACMCVRVFGRGIFLSILFPSMNLCIHTP